MLMVLFTIGLCLIFIVSTSGNFIKTPKDVTSCSGNDIILDWLFSGSPSVVTWELLPDTQIMSYVSIIGLATPNENYQGRISHNGNGSITLKGVTESESGTYQCSPVYILSAPKDQVEVIVYNRMKVAPDIEYNVTTNKLSCNVLGVSLGVSFKWTYSGNEIGSSNIVTPTQSGDYTCSVAGDAIALCKGEGVITSTTLSVHLEKPVVSIDHQILNTAEGQSITLQCNLERAAPQIILEWRWYKIGHEENILSKTPSFTIDYISPAHAGNYSCIARNIIGESDPSVTTLNIFVPPVIAVMENKTPTEGSSLTLLCNITSNPVPSNNQVFWTKVDEVSFKVIGRTLSLQNINRQDTGIYSCNVNVSMVLNSGQWISKSATENVRIDVLYGPGDSMKISPDSDVTYYYENGRTNPVVCTAVCNPTCRIYWKDPYGNTLDGNTLRLGNASRSMNGTYTCIAENVIASLSYSSNRSIVIIVYYTASIISAIPQGPVSVQEGNDILLECKTDGYPISTLIWKKDKEIFDRTDVINNDEGLYFSNVNRSDAGQYTCEATNGIGSTKIAEFNIIVQYPPGTSISLTGPSRTINIIEGNALADITCNAQCVPECSYNWIYPNGSSVPGRVLSLNKAARHMNGTYFCYAQNEIASGKHSSRIDVAVIVFYPCEKERWFVRSTHNVDVGADVTINCPIEGNPEPLMTWSKDGKNLNIDTTEKYLQLRNVSCEDSGEYTCTADNNIGQPVSQPFNVSVLCKTTEDTEIEKSERNESLDDDTIIFAAVGAGSGFLLIVIIFVIFAAVKCRSKKIMRVNTYNMVKQKEDPHGTAQETTQVAENQSIHHIYDTIQDQPDVAVNPYSVGYVRYYPDNSSSRDSHSTTSGDGNICSKNLFHEVYDQTSAFVDHMNLFTPQVDDITETIKAVEDKFQEKIKANEDKLQDLEKGYNEILRRLDERRDQITDCGTLHSINPSLPDGVYRISLKHDEMVSAFCNMSDGGWTVFQRRVSGDVNFYRKWIDYRIGFGDPAGEYWLGNEFLHQLTKNRNCLLKIDMVNWDALAHFAHYTYFRIDSETEAYRLHIGNYSGDAGDSLSFHNEMKFSTWDVNNGIIILDCLLTFSGAWWYESCHDHSNLNGDFFQRNMFGVKW